MANSNAARAMPTAMAATPGRVRSRVIIASLKPRFSSPIRFSAGHLDVVERDRRGVGGALPELVLLLVDRDAVPLALDDERADALVARVLVGLRVDGVVVGVAAVGDEALRAVEDVLVTLLDGGRAHARDVGAGVRLGQAERGELELLGQHPEVLLLGLLGAAEDDRRGGQAVAGQARADARTAPAELLLDQAARQEVEARAAVLLGDVGVHQAHFPGLLEDVAAARSPSLS